MCVLRCGNHILQELRGGKYYSVNEVRVKSIDEYRRMNLEFVLQGPGFLAPTPLTMTCDTD